MNFTFQTKVQITVILAIAALLMTVQSFVVDEMQDKTVKDFQKRLEMFVNRKESFVKYGFGTKIDYVNQISKFIDTVENRKLWIAISKLKLEYENEYHSHSISFYDSTLKPLRMFRTEQAYPIERQSTTGKWWSAQYSGSKIQQDDDMVYEIEKEFINYLIALGDYPVVFNYFAQMPDRGSSLENSPLLIELSVKNRDKKDMKDLFLQTYKGHKWRLIDSTYNLIFIASDMEKMNRTKQTKKNFICLEKSSRVGDVFLISWDKIADGFERFYEDTLYAQSTLAKEDFQKGYTSFVDRDEATGLSFFLILPRAQYSGYIIILYVIGFIYAMLLAFIVKILFWQITSHINYFSKLTQEFNENVKFTSLNDKLIDYHHSVLDFYYSILSKFLPGYRQKIVKEVFQYNLNEFSKIVTEMNELRNHLEKQVAERTKELENSLNNLKQTQAQLIQSEKMASLGQLTAGIAHEIKNPLNFVNNFSELSVELFEELREKIGNTKNSLASNDAEEVQKILSDLVSLLDKINEHGKRADSIVRGMLLHAHSGVGEKVETDINALVDEYLKLSYHGFRARDKSFNISMVTDYDPALPKVTVVPQDISRVFTNIITNGCYAAYQKRKRLGDSFSPEIRISTKRQDGLVEIRIRDNGDGISTAIADKIFHPFFTTKPSKEGTGLGLSISYDIVVNVHQGEIKVESEEGKYAEFIITLPLK